MEEEKPIFKVGDKIVGTPERIAVHLKRKAAGQTLDLYQEDMITLPYMTVSKVKESGSFQYSEWKGASHAKSLQWFNPKHFILYEDFEELPAEEKKQFISEVLGCLYKDKCMYSKIKQLIKTP